MSNSEPSKAVRILGIIGAGITLTLGLIVILVITYKLIEFLITL